MKIKNATKHPQPVMLQSGQSFTVLPDELTPDLAGVCGAELLREFPSIWEVTDVEPTKKTKKES